MPHQHDIIVTAVSTSSRRVRLICVLNLCLFAIFITVVYGCSMVLFTDITEQCFLEGFECSVRSVYIELLCR